MNTIIKTAIAALTLVAGASASQAEPQTVWHFPYKGAPYVTRVEPAHTAAPVQVLRKAMHAAGHVRTASKTQVIR